MNSDKEPKSINVGVILLKSLEPSYDGIYDRTLTAWNPVKQAFSKIISAISDMYSPIYKRIYESPHIKEYMKAQKKYNKRVLNRQKLYDKRKKRGLI